MTRSKSRKSPRRPWARKPKWRACGAFKYNINGNGMSPFFIGLAAAEFLPADPQVWFDAASAAGMTAEKAWTPGFAVDKDTKNFLKGWLYGTPGGRKPSPHG